MKTSNSFPDPLARRADPPRGGCALGVMTKAPRAGASKTRLVPPLTHEEAARLSAAFLRDTAANVADACAESSPDARAAYAFAVYTPAGARDAFDNLLPPHFALLAQRGDAFGERLFNASADLLQLGYDSCCLIDSDSPTLPRALLTAAIAELSRPGDRLVLGPADDGGYYLIGLKRAHPHLFAEIAWSTPSVLAQTIERAREIDLDVRILPAWYDVDDAATLRRLSDELFGTGRDGDHRRDTHADEGAHHRPKRDSDSVSNHVLCPTTKPIPYPAPHTRAALALLLGAEGRARLPADSACAPKEGMA